MIKIPKSAKETDCLWFDIFIVLQLFVYCVIFYAFSEGNSSILIQPIDVNNQVCGSSPKVQDFPYIYYATPQAKYLYRNVCVSSCPVQGEIKIECQPDYEVLNCLENKSLDYLPMQILVYDSVLYANTVCLPTNLQMISELGPSALPANVNIILGDLNFCQKTIFQIIFVALVFCFIVKHFLIEKTELTIWIANVGNIIFTFLLGVLLISHS